MSQNISILYVGLDVAKLTFVVHWQGRIHQLSNDPKGHARLVALLTASSATPVTIHVILEATGGYEQPIVRALHQAGLLVSVILPNRVRHFAKGHGRLAKTDPIDASMLTLYGQSVKPKPTAPTSALALELAELVTQRRQLVQQLVMLKNQGAHFLSKTARRINRSLEQQLTKQITALESALAKLLAKDADLRQRTERFQQVKGIGPVVAAVLVAEMPELGSLRQSEAAALAGVAPYNADSSTIHGARHISGGRTHARSALYMAALTACRWDPVLKAFYQHLLSKGKAKLVALTAVMRKLIVLLNHMLKHPEFTLQKAPAK
jgi:transposase